MPAASFRGRFRKAKGRLLLGILLASMPVSLFALPPTTTLFYYVEEPPAFTPQVFVMDRDGFVFGGVNPELLEAARQRRVAVMPLVMNKGFEQATIHAVLLDPAKMQRAIRYLLYYADRDDRSG
jgi:hypothetical protein